MKSNTLKLTEYIPHQFDQYTISQTVGESIWRKYSQYVSVEFPSPKTGGRWQLTSQGWVGFIPCGDQLLLALQPKVELANLFRMLEYAYRLKSFRFLDDLIQCNSLEEFYERLANVLSKRVLDRSRRGFYRAYMSESERLPFVRGRISIKQNILTPWDVNLHCHYEDHTPDIEENQLLAWTLFQIANSGMCTPRVLPTVRKAFHSLRGFTTLKSFTGRDCVARWYNRLNSDYQPLHALCRFFLDHTGPAYDTGDKSMLPFLVDMAHLYELFVAEWLKSHLPSYLQLRIQEKVDVGERQILSFKIDLVLYDSESGRPLCVLDTKYKTGEKPNTDDVAKAVTYAEMKRCRKAFLIYPAPLSEPYEGLFGSIRVKSSTFSLSGDLEKAGHSFITNLLQDLN